MKHLLEDPDALEKISTADQLSLFLDYDGTLTPIAGTPQQALMPQETRDILQTLSKISRFHLAIISGRAMKDLQKLVGIDGIIYVGNHGFEIQGPGIVFEGLIPPKLEELFERLKYEINRKLAAFAGAFIEDKGLTFSVHYRLANQSRAMVLEHILSHIVKPHLTKKEIRVGSGKRVFEIRPPVEWDKGKAVTWILTKQQFAVGQQRILPICIGDDATDEDVFLAMKDRGMAVYVGNPRASHAQYYLNSTGEVIEFLKRIQEIRTP